MRSPDRIKIFCSLALLALSLQAEDRVLVRGHVPAALARLAPSGRLPATNRLQLAIGLALRNPQGLTNLLRQLYDPANGAYHHYLTPEQFTASFGPTEAEYQALMAFVKARGLAVSSTHANRMLVDVTGTAADVEKAFKVKLDLYAHPKEARAFFAPEAEPSVAKGLRVVHISGLDNYASAHPLFRRHGTGPAYRPTPCKGSSPDGSGAYFGGDYRNAYLPGLSLTGKGQVVGLLELDGYYQTDIIQYEKQAKLPAVPLVNVLVDGFNGVPIGFYSFGGFDEEVALDIEMAMSMAPGLSQVRVYEATPSSTMANVNDLLNLMATENFARQLSSSWTFDIDTISEQIFQEMAAQGQSFFQASGDNGAWSGFVAQPSDNPFVTVVGGTVLATGAGGGWVSETAWDFSGGGISSIYPLPDWQQGTSMATNHGSTKMRNVPDVAMLARNAWVCADDGQSFALDGTSISAPLWSAFTALVNEQAAALGRPPVGFLNPALYAIGNSSNYLQCFHDITSGDNTTSNSPSLFFAVQGYDLCTGWGTPGTNLIPALLAQPTEPLVIMPPLGLYAQGPVGGPFNVTTETYILTNAGAAPLNWSLANASPWFQVSTFTNGTLLPGGPAATVTATLNSAASNLLIGSYTASLSFTNLTDGLGQDRQLSLLVGNGGFETGDFACWNLAADTISNFVDSIDTAFIDGASTVTNVDDSSFVHSGIYGAFLGQARSSGTLSQTVPTTVGQHYLLSFWLDNPTNAPGTFVDFEAIWNGAQVFRASRAAAFGWTNIQTVVRATKASTSLEFQFQNDGGAFGLDDISLVPAVLPAPRIQRVTLTNGAISLTWQTTPGLAYQAQYTEDLSAPAWSDLGATRNGAGGTVTVVDALIGSPQKFYRIVAH